MLLKGHLMHTVGVLLENKQKFISLSNDWENGFKEFPDDIDEANTQIMLRLKQSQQEIH